MAEKEPSQKPYKNVAVRPPTMEELTDLAKQFGLQCIEKDLSDIKGHIGGILTSYQRLDEMVAPTLPVKYPRVPGRRPETKENKYNAWFWKCIIKGASEGLLKGKRVAIKDNICVSGVTMSNGSKIMEEFVPDIDATVVFTGDADMAIGGDQGGSIRIPSSWCGIVGLKPTWGLVWAWGLVPYTGAVPIEITCDHLGPMAKTVADCALLLEVIAGFDDGNDCRQPRDLQVPKYSQMLTGDISGKKIGLVKEAFDGCDEGVQKVVRDAANTFTKAGAVVQEFSLPAHNDAVDVWGVICTEGGYDCLFKENGAGYQNKGYYSTAIIEKLRSGYKTHPDNLSDVMKLVLLFGEYISQKYGNKFYAKAQNLCKKITEEYNNVLEHYDVLVMPTLPYTAPPLPSTESSVKERLVNSLGMVKNTAPFDCTGLPALTINAGYCDKLPVGMTIVGKSFDEMSVLQAARAYEKLRDG